MSLTAAKWKLMEMYSETLSSIFHHIWKSDFILMQSQLYLCDKRPLKFIDKYSHNWLLEWVAFGHSTVDIFTPTPLFFPVFSLYIQLCQFLNYCVSGLVQKKKKESWWGGWGLGYSDIHHHQPTQNYSM